MGYLGFNGMTSEEYGDTIWVFLKIPLLINWFVAGLRMCVCKYLTQENLLRDRPHKDLDVYVLVVSHLLRRRK